MGNFILVKSSKSSKVIPGSSHLFSLFILLWETEVVQKPCGYLTCAFDHPALPKALEMAPVGITTLNSSQMNQAIPSRQSSGFSERWQRRASTISCLRVAGLPGLFAGADASPKILMLRRILRTVRSVVFAAVAISTFEKRSASIMLTIRFRRKRDSLGAILKFGGIRSSKLLRVASCDWEVVICKSKHIS